MEIVDDRRSRLREAHRQLQRADLYIVAARELVGADSDSGRELEHLRDELLLVGEHLRSERRLQPPVPRPLRAIGE